MTPGDSFTWYAGAMSSNGQAQVWNTGQSFTLAALTAPTPTGPSGSIASSTPTFAWSIVTGANHYYLYVVDDTSGTVAINNPDITTSTFTPGTALTLGHEYTWYVFAFSTNGQDVSYLSEGTTFTIT